VAVPRVHAGDSRGHVFAPRAAVRTDAPLHAAAVPVGEARGGDGARSRARLHRVFRRVPRAADHGGDRHVRDLQPARHPHWGFAAALGSSWPSRAWSGCRSGASCGRKWTRKSYRVAHRAIRARANDFVGAAHTGPLGLSELVRGAHRRLWRFTIPRWAVERSLRPPVHRRPNHPRRARACRHATVPVPDKADLPSDSEMVRSTPASTSRAPNRARASRSATPPSRTSISGSP